MSVRGWMACMPVLLMLGGYSAAGAVPPAPPPAPAFVLSPAASTRSEVGFSKRILWYIPNRVMDFLDVFRFRVRLGPGLAAGFRITNYAAFYWGEYYSVYGGIPGPRNPRYVRWPIGVESLKGIVFAGVDATDDTPYGPQYGPTEVDFGVHLGVAGADLGVDPLEFADFLSGFFLFDLERDDYPRPSGPASKSSSGVSRGTAQGMFLLGEKPPKFINWTDRLDYLHTNIHQRVSRPVRTLDEYFAPDYLERAAIPDSRLRLGIYAESVRSETRKNALKQDVDLDVSLPNMEHRLNVFVQSGHADELPGRPLSETADQSLIVGVRRFIKQSAISA